MQSATVPWLLVALGMAHVNVTEPLARHLHLGDAVDRKGGGPRSDAARHVEALLEFALEAGVLSKYLGLNA